MNLGNFFFKYRGFTPVPFLLIIFILARPTYGSFLSGTAFMVLGEVVRIWGVAYAGGATRTRNVGAERLVTEGPFARVRNPLYLGNLFMYCGVAIIANFRLPYTICFVLIFFGFQYYQIVKLEEETLTELFGHQYLAYQKRVPRFIPRLKSTQAERNIVPDYRNALRSERSTFIGFVLVLLLFFIKMQYFSHVNGIQ